MKPVGHQLLSAECLVRYQISPCEISDTETGTGTVFSVKTSVQSVNYGPTAASALFLSIYLWSRHRQQS
jgi:hypothetical protein